VPDRLAQRDRARRVAGVVLAGAVLALVAATSGTASNTRVTAATRRAIDATLDSFVPEAVERLDPAAAWALAGPGLRAGTTRADWVAGRLPVYPYQARGRTFHGWTPSYASPGQVGFDLLLQPRRGAKTGVIAFSVIMRLVRGRWLVDYWAPVASYSPAGAKPQIIGPGDLVPPSERGRDQAGSARLGAIWLVVPVAVISLAGIFAIGFAVVGWRRRRVGRGRGALPPLPGTSRPMR
jgi:hypothetical protein